MASEKSRHKAIASEGHGGAGEGSLSTSHPAFWGSHISLFPVCATKAASPSSDTVPFSSHFFHLRTQVAGAPVLTERQDTPKDTLPHMTSSGFFFVFLYISGLTSATLILREELLQAGLAPIVANNPHLGAKLQVSAIPKADAHLPSITLVFQVFSLSTERSQCVLALQPACCKTGTRLHKYPCNLIKS